MKGGRKIGGVSPSWSCMQLLEFIHQILGAVRLGFLRGIDEGENKSMSTRLSPPKPAPVHTHASLSVCTGTKVCKDTAGCHTDCKQQESERRQRGGKETRAVGSGVLAKATPTVTDMRWHMHGAGLVPWDSTKMWALQFYFHFMLYLHRLISLQSVFFFTMIMVTYGSEEEFYFNFELVEEAQSLITNAHGSSEVSSSELGTLLLFGTLLLRSHPRMATFRHEDT